MRRIPVLITIFLVFSACQAKPVLVRPPLEAEGAVYVYLAPYPEEARRLAFHISEMFAVRESGERYPLSLILTEVSAGPAGRERLLASGALPPGQYSGLAVNVEKASLKVEEGDAALVVPEEMAGVAVPFAVAGKRAVVLSLAFRYRESVREEFGFVPVFSVAIPNRPPTGLIGLASSRGANVVTQFDKVSGRVVSVIPTGRSPAGMALDSARLRAYAALSGEDAVEVIDLLESTVIGRVQLMAGDVPVELAMTPDGRKLLAANSGSNTVSVIDPSAFVETNRVRVGAGPQSILIDRTGRKAYVFNTLSNSISVLDIPQESVVGTITTEPEPIRGQLSRDGSRLYVLQRFSPYLAVVDPASLSTARRIYVGGGGTALKVDPRTDLIYLSRLLSDEIEVFDPFSALPVDAVRAGGEAAYVAIDGEENNLFIVLPGKNRLRAVRLVGKETAAEIDLADDPYWVTMMGER